MISQDKVAFIHLDNRPCDSSNYKYDFCLEIVKSNFFTHLLDQGTFISSWKRLAGYMLGKDLYPRGEDHIYRGEILKVFPFESRFSLLAIWNRSLTAWLLKRWIKDKGYCRKFLIVSRPEHRAWLHSFSDVSTIYDVRDSYVHYPNNWKRGPETYLHEEGKLMESVDAVICVSKPLYERALKHNTNSHFIPNGVDPNFFTATPPSHAKKKDRPSTLLIGSMDERVHFEWLFEAAQNLQDMDFNFVGPIKTKDPRDLESIEALKCLPNVQFHGAVSFDQFPKIIADCDIALLPYKVNDWTNATSPIKLYQYLAMGKSIVSTPLFQCMEYEALIHPASSSKQLQQQIRAAQHKVAREDFRKRVQAAQNASWENRVKAWKAVWTQIAPKTLLISRTFLPVVGGIETFYHQLSLGVGEKMTVLTAGHSHSGAFDEMQPYQIIRKNLRHEPKKMGRFSIWLSDRIERKLVKDAVRDAMRQRHPEVIIVGDGWLSWLLPWLQRHFSGKSLAFFHGKEIARMHQFNARSELKSVQFADEVIVNSRYTQDLVVKAPFPQEKVNVLHPGVDTELFNPTITEQDAKKALKLEGRKVILSIARLAERKGIQNAIQALPNILEEYPEAIYVIVGDGPMRQTLKDQVAALKLEEHVRFAGRVTTEELPLYHASADVFILPNLYLEKTADAEGFGIVFLEANACGKPVIGGRNGGTEDAILDENTGILIDSQNIESISAVIQDLLRDKKKRRELGLQGLERAQKEFAWDVIKEKFRQCLKN